MERLAFAARFAFAAGLALAARLAAAARKGSHEGRVCVKRQRAAAGDSTPGAAVVSFEKAVASASKAVASTVEAAAEAVAETRAAACLVHRGRGRGVNGAFAGNIEMASASRA